MTSVSELNMLTEKAFNALDSLLSDRQTLASIEDSKLSSEKIATKPLNSDNPFSLALSTGTLESEITVDEFLSENTDLQSCEKESLFGSLGNFLNQDEEKRQLDFGWTSEKSKSMFDFGFDSKKESSHTKPLFDFTLNNSKDTKSEPSLFSFGSKGSELFEKKESGLGEESAKAGPDIEAEPENITFKPIVKLQEIENHENGQENDEIVFEEQAKIYQFDMERGQWVDFGKVCLQISSKKIVARDEITKKLRLCGAISKGSDLELKKTKGCSWGMKDFSRGEPENILVSAKFKNKEIRAQFASKFESCLAEE